MQQLCNSNEDIPIRFRIFADETLVSSTVTSVSQLREKSELTLLDVKNGSFAGVLRFNDFHVIENANFVDYLRSGW